MRSAGTWKRTATCATSNSSARRWSSCGARYTADAAELRRIPASGRLLIVANHPSGALDALALLDAVGQVRRDVKIIANDLPSALEPLSGLLLPIRIGRRSTASCCWLNSSSDGAERPNATSPASCRRVTTRRGLGGIVCGHIHRAALFERDGCVYANDGAEDPDGTLRLLSHAGETMAVMPPRLRPIRQVPALSLAA